MVQARQEHESREAVAVPDASLSDLPADMLDLLAHVPVSAAAKRDVVRRMRGADRFYHGINHLVLLWRRHRRYGAAEGLDGASTTVLIACAILFHDAIYDSRRSDSEELSARLWLASSNESEMAEADRMWVADTIRATSAHLSYQPDEAFTRLGRSSADVPPEVALRERARIWFLDLDLTPLGEEAAIFDKNSLLLRQEAPHLSDAESSELRLRFLDTFAKVPMIYRTATLAAVFDAQARRNIVNVLAA